MKIEITKPLKLSKNQYYLLDNHSLMNILTILMSEIELSGMMSGCKDKTSGLVSKVYELRKMLKRSVTESDDFRHLSELEEEAKVLFELMVKKTENDVEIQNAIMESGENVARIFSVFKARVEELFEREADDLSWKWSSIEGLYSNFDNVLVAIAKNSKGKYDIVENIARKTERDYVVNLKIESEDTEAILMPAVMQDCLRDLIANARKYTKPGGEIHAGLYNNGRELTMVVKDSGCGIPEDEIEKVVNFGYRATNVLDKPTKGGGFGLTKAYYITKKFNGRFWISSAPEKGTEVTVKIPVPDYKGMGS